MRGVITGLRPKHHNTPLIPAKAGIQNEYYRPCVALWMPAFAGMSGVCVAR